MKTINHTIKNIPTIYSFIYLVSDEVAAFAAGSIFLLTVDG